MSVYFFREKNADSFIGKDGVTVLEVSGDELLRNIKNKLIEKVEMINVIFEKSSRESYLKEKGKVIDMYIPEFEIQQKIGTRVIVDFLDLIYSLCKLLNISLDTTIVQDESVSINFYIDLRKYVEDLCEDNNVSENIQLIFDTIFFMSKYLGLKMQELDKERKIIEYNEGSFYNGKLVCGFEESE